MSTTLTNEQITERVGLMQSQLHQCAQTGKAYRVKWHDVKEIIAIITTLQQRLAEANDFNNDVVEREAAVCPEDVGFDEYIRVLQSQNTALREQLAQVRAENERLASQLGEWQEEKDAEAGYL